MSSMTAEQVLRKDMPEYRSWMAARNRCFNPKATDYHNYGGRGISMCSRWNDFDAFVTDVGKRPSRKHSLDRIDNDGNYEPGNCRWATHIEQQRNKRTCRMVEAFGETKTVVDWCNDGRCSVCYSALVYRIYSGWDAEVAITSPSKSRQPAPKHAISKNSPHARRGRGSVMVQAFGESKSVVEWSMDSRCKAGIAALYRRIHAGVSPETAITTPTIPHGKRNKAMTYAVLAAAKEGA